jgi:hypothetical protein
LNEPSIATVSAASATNIIAGYYEISWFHSNYFNNVVNQENIESFSFVKFWVSEVVPNVNYEYLFKTYGDLPGTEPPLNSLFNIENFKTLVNLGFNTQNILKNTSLVYGDDFDLGDDWFALTTSLGLSSIQQTYMIWLWLDTAYDMTYSRVQDGGNAQVGAISGIGANSLQDTMTIMMLELPMFTWASQFNISYAANVTSLGQDCSSFYTIIGFPTAQTAALCADASNTFNFV